MDRLTKYSEDCRALADECGGLDRLRELAEADRDGRLVVLPARRGRKNFLSSTLRQMSMKTVFWRYAQLYFLPRTGERKAGAQP